MSRKFGRRRLGILSLALVCGIVAAGVAWHIRAVRFSRDVEELRQTETSLKRAADEALPQGSDISRIEGFLGKHQMEYTHYRASSSGGEQIPAILDAYTQYIETSSLSCKLHFTFTLDSKDRLLAYKEKCVCAP
jgi:hypothetical protein